MKQLLGIFLLFAVSITYAQESTLTFKEAVKIALDNSINLKQQQNQLYVNQSQKLQSQSQFLPSLSIRGYAQRTDGQQISPVTGQGEDVTSDQFGASVNASLSLFNGFSRINSLKQSTYSFKAQDKAVHRAKQDVIFNVSNQYLQVLLDVELLRISQENLESQKKLYEQIKGFYDAGMRPVTDVYTQEAQVKNFEVQVIQSENRLRNDKSILAQILQLDPILDFVLERPNWDVNSDEFNQLQLEGLYAIAQQNRPDLHQAQENMNASKFGYKSSLSGYLPSFDLFASYGSQYFSRGADGEDSFKTQFVELNPTLSYGFQFSIPLFDRFSTKTNRVTNRIQYENSVNNQQNLEKTVKIDVQRSYQNYQGAIKSYTFSQAQFRAAELSYQTQKESYDLEVANQLELAQATQLYVQAQASLAQAELSLMFQSILLDYNLGTLKFEDIP